MRPTLRECQTSEPSCSTHRGAGYAEPGGARSTLGKRPIDRRSRHRLADPLERPGRRFVLLPDPDQLERYDGYLSLTPPVDWSETFHSEASTLLAPACWNARSDFSALRRSVRFRQRYRKPTESPGQRRCGFPLKSPWPSASHRRRAGRKPVPFRSSAWSAPAPKRGESARREFHGRRSKSKPGSVVFPPRSG